MLVSSLALDCCVGIALHLLVFRHGEWDMAGPALAIKLLGFGTPLLSGAAMLAYTRTDIPSDAFLNLAKHSSVIATALTLSILIYRWYFHRLHVFPGPLRARLSIAYVIWKSAISPNGFKMSQKLHKEYGDFVRVGPCELSVSHPEAITAIHSATSNCIKGAWYDILQPYRSLFGIRDRAKHQRRRKLWDAIFRPGALKEYELAMQPCIDLLLDKLRMRAVIQDPVDMTKWFGLLTFDIIGVLSFGDSFGTLSAEKPHYMMDYLRESHLATGILIRAVWLLMFVRNMPILNRSIQQFLDFSEQIMDKRLCRKDKPRDIFSWLWDDFSAKGERTVEARRNLVADATLAIFAGSDTVSITMTGIIYYLMAHPQYQRALHQEFDTAEREQATLDSQTLAKLPMLNSIINETLRLHYPGPSGFPRTTPAEGIRVGDTFIPGEVHVKVPIYTVFRDARSFKDPDEFIPERWSTKKDLVHRPEAFAPFLIGPYNCVGKNLALLQIRRIIYAIVREFELQPCQDNLRQYESQQKDGFNMGLGSLITTFKPRSCLK